MRKVLVLLLLTALAVGTFCSVAAAATSLEVWVMQPGNADVEQLLKNVKADFEATHKDVTVNLQFIPWMSAWQKITTAVAAGEAPDVSELGTTMTPFYAEMGALLEMDSYLDKWGIRKDLDPGLAESAMSEGKYYGVPWYGGARMLMYRKDFFAEAGIKKAPTTWEEFLAAAKAIQKVGKDGKVERYGFAFQGGAGRLTWLPFIWQNGAEISVKKDGKWVSTIDSPESIAAIRFYTDLLLKHHLAPEASLTWNALNARQAFALGNAGMIIEGPWAIGGLKNTNPDIEKVLGVALLPGNKKMATFAGGSNFVVYRQSKKRDLAADFVRLMVSEKYQLELARLLKFLPGRVSFQKNKMFTSDPILKVAVDQMEYGRSFPAAAGWGSVEKLNVPNVMMDRILTGKMTVEQAANWAADKMNDLYTQ
jgi:N,N'-diacetylchitobiose transport system substrate-binding protein